jgi:hypothetical protein
VSRKCCTAYISGIFGAKKKKCISDIFLDTVRLGEVKGKKITAAMADSRVGFLSAWHVWAQLMGWHAWCAAYSE